MAPTRSGVDAVDSDFLAKVKQGIPVEVDGIHIRASEKKLRWFSLYYVYANGEYVGFLRLGHFYARAGELPGRVKAIFEREAPRSGDGGLPFR